MVNGHRSVGMVRLAAYGMAIALTLHFVLPMLPLTPNVLRWIEIILGWVAISSLFSLLYADYRRGGQLLSQAREEMLLIGAFGLFWLAIAAMFRSWHRRALPLADTHTGIVSPGTQLGGVPAGASGRRGAAVGDTTNRQQYGEWPLRGVGTGDMGSQVRTTVTYVVEEVWQRYM